LAVNNETSLKERFLFRSAITVKTNGLWCTESKEMHAGGWRQSLAGFVAPSCPLDVVFWQHVRQQSNI
jgi:hypothetical protein